jgi:hypothetical protein
MLIQILYSLCSSDKMLGVPAAQESGNQEDYKDCDDIGDDLSASVAHS